MDVKLPYAILVNKAAQIVTVHTLDESGQYTIVVRQMLCSTGYTRKRTPEGLYTLKAERYPIAGMVDGTKARYAIRMTGSYLFHSVPYRNNNPDSMYGEKYNALGTMSSLGCIRLALADIHWIYENCPAGTPVEIIWGEEDPQLWNQLKRGPVSFEYGWDPTDPDSPAYRPNHVTDALRGTPARPTFSPQTAIPTPRGPRRSSTHRPNRSSVGNARRAPKTTPSAAPTDAPPEEPDRRTRRQRLPDDRIKVTQI